MMEQHTITQNIEVVFLTVPHFPNDVPATYEKLHSLIEDKPDRRYFGISHPNEAGIILYKAAAEILPSDNLNNVALETFTIEKGNFVSTYIVNHFQNSDSISNAFQELLKHPKLDPQGYCLEVYKNYTDLDVHCMVKILG